MSKPQTIKHVMHSHPLTKVDGVGTFTCDGCKLYGDGITYRCSDCDYDLHEYCATCPPSLRNSSHGPNHELSMFDNSTYKHVRSCFVCKAYIQGMFYKCNQCSFESHPLCAHAPMQHASSPDISDTKQRSLHGHPASPSPSPSPPHHYNGYHYAYPYMSPPVAYPHGGAHQHHPTKSESPKLSSKPSPSTPETKKKKKGFFGTIASATVTVAAQFAVAAIAGDDMSQY